MAEKRYEDQFRARMTELRLKKDVSEHKMSLDLDKSGSYIRFISSGASLPSVKEMFNIIAYLDVYPAEFFMPFRDNKTPQDLLCERIQSLSAEQVSKVHIFLDMIEK